MKGMYTSKIDWPFKVKTFLPIGHLWGNKNRETIRNSFHRNEEGADQEMVNWSRMGIKTLKIKR